MAGYEIFKCTQRNVALSQSRRLSPSHSHSHLQAVDGIVCDHHGLDLVDCRLSPEASVAVVRGRPE